jgi:acetylornithine/N-succinyldiaminopimelate aminotransferase
MGGVDVTEPANPVVGRALEQGLLLVGAGEHTIRLLPPLVINGEALTEGMGRLERAIG